jgi:hypothetical protein
LLAGHTGQLPFTGFGALRRFLRGEGPGKQQEAGEKEFAHGAASPLKINESLTS